MKKIIVIWLSIVCIIVLAGCTNNSPSKPQISEPLIHVSDASVTTEKSDTSGENALQNTPSTEKRDTIPTVNIQVGNKNFTAILEDNDSTQALLKKFPLTLDMEELNGNEKFYFFSERLPTNSEGVRRIKIGDLMLYGSDCFVLFYESFSTSYSYTRLGYIEDVAGLANALGSGSIQVIFSIND